MAQDLEAAKGYKWNVRVQGQEGLLAKVHSRNHTLMVGQPADFSPKVDAPSAIDYFLGSIAADLTVGFKAQASRRNMEIDQMEVSLKAGLENVLFHLELENEGSPKIKQITGTFYVSSPNSEDELQNLWKVRLNDPLFTKLLTNRSKSISNFQLFFKALFSNFVAWIEKLILLVFTLILDFIFEKRAANFIRKHKISNCYVKIGLWILTTNFTKTAFIKEEVI